MAIRIVDCSSGVNSHPKTHYQDSNQWVSRKPYRVGTHKQIINSMKHKIKLATRTVAIIALVFTAFSWNAETLFAGSQSYCEYTLSQPTTSRSICEAQATCNAQAWQQQCIAVDPNNDARKAYCQNMAAAIHEEMILDCHAIHGCPKDDGHSGGNGPEGL